MKRKFVISILLFLSLFVGVASANGLPAKGSEHIYDTAGMFPSSQLKDLEQAAAAGTLYSYYILTVDSLGNEKADAYIKNVYQTWNLRSDDILILLSKNDRQIQLYFINAPLQKKLDALPQNYAGGEYMSRSSIDRFVGKNFTPAAKQGDFVTGVKNMISAANQLPEAASQPNTTATPQVTPKASVATKNDFANTEKKENKSPLLLVIGILSVAAAGVVLFLTVRYNKRKSKKAQLIGEAKTIIVDLFRAQEALNPLLSLYSGSATDQTLKPLSNAIDACSEKMQAAIQSVNDHQIHFLSGTSSREITQFATTIGLYKNEAHGLCLEAKRLAALDQSNSNEVKEIQASLLLLTERADDLARTYSMSLKHMKEEIASNQLQTQETYKRQLTDLIDAVEILKPQREQTALHHRLLDELPSLLEWRHKYPAKIDSADMQIKEQLRQHHLELVEFNPFNPISDAKHKVESLSTALNKGDLQDASRLSSEIAGSLEMASEMVRLRLELRESITQDLQKLDQFVKTFTFTESVYREELSKIQYQFHESVWEFMPSSYASASKAFSEVEAGIASAKHDYHGQKYNAVRSELDLLLKLANQATDKSESCMKARQLALKQLEDLQNTTAEHWQKYQSALSLVSAHQLPLRNASGSHLEGLSDRIRVGKGTIDRVLFSPPIHLGNAEPLVQQFIHHVETFNKDVQLLVEEKQAAEKRLREVKNRYDSVHARTSHRSISNHFSSAYHSNMTEVQHLFTMGLYAEAIHRMNDAERDIQQIQSAYDELIREEQRRQQEEERRREDERRQEEARRQQDEASRQQNANNSPNSASSGGDSYDPSGSTGGDKW